MVKKKFVRRKKNTIKANSGLLAAGIVCLAVIIAIPLIKFINFSGHAQNPPAIDEFSTPTSNSSPQEMVKGPDGNIWFTESNTNKIGKITPQGNITEYTLVSPVSAVPSLSLRGITVGPDNNIWFIESSLGRPGKLDINTGEITDYPYPDGIQPIGNYITSGPDGNLWFTTAGDQVHRINKVTPNGEITQYKIDSPECNDPLGCIPTRIIQGPDGNLWFIAYWGDFRSANYWFIGKITTSGDITLYPTSSSPYVQPVNLVVGSDGNVWFAISFNHTLNKITTDGQITSYPIDPQSEISTMTNGSDGNIRFIDIGNSVIGVANTNGEVINQIPFPLAARKYPITAAEGADGNLWFTESLVSKIGRLSFPDPTEIPTITPTETPYLDPEESPTEEPTPTATPTPMPPNTSAITTGTQGLNGWYKSNVSITLKAVGAGGILRTIYYYDGSSQRNTYTGAITISNEGTTKIWYYSLGTNGTSEQPKSLTVKIDKTAPEIIVQFDPQTKQLVGSGSDGMSGVNTVNQTTTTITVSDIAGNSTKFTYSAKKNISSSLIGTQNMTISGLSYNDVPATIPQTTIIIAWTFNKSGQITNLVQTYTIKKQTVVLATYTSGKNSSTALEITPQGKKVTKSKVNGLDIIKLVTNKGQLSISY